jgi:TRAP-type C4-dicarboxylate transport system substrate-binding protein
MKKLLVAILAIVLINAFILGGCAEPTPAPAPAPTPSPTPAPAPTPTPPKEPTVLKLVSFYPKTPGMSVFSYMLADRVKDKSKGELIIDYVGGPEVISPPDLPPAVQRGSIDIAAVSYAMSDKLAPGGICILLSDITLEEFRKGGAFDLISEQFRKAGIFILGSAIPCYPNSMARIHLNKKVEKIEDLDGLKIGCVGDNWLYWFDSMGAAGVTINMPDYYTAMERGTVDAVELGITGIRDFSLFDVVKYELDHPYSSYGAAYQVNLERWNSLTQNQQDIMIEVQLELEQEGPEIMAQMVREIDEELKKGGTQFIKFSPEDEKKFYDLYRENVWKFAIEKRPEIAPQFKELLTKK